MNVGRTPDPSDFTITVDAVAKTPDAVQWLNNRVLQLTYTEPVLGPTNVSLAYCECNEDLQTADGINVFQFDISGDEQINSAEWLDDNPDVRIEVAYNFDIVQNPAAAVAPWTVTWAAFSEQPDTAAITSAQEATLTLLNDFPPAGVVNVEFTTVNADYKDLTGRFHCPFLLSNIPAG